MTASVCDQLSLDPIFLLRAFCTPALQNCYPGYFESIFGHLFDPRETKLSRTPKFIASFDKENFLGINGDRCRCRFRLEKTGKFTENYTSYTEVCMQLCAAREFFFNET